MVESLAAFERQYGFAIALKGDAMTDNDRESADRSSPRLAGRRRVHHAAKLMVTISLTAAACVLAYHSMSGFKEEWQILTAASMPAKHQNTEQMDELPLVRGNRIYKSHCERCHGAEGRGDGPALADAGKRRGRDLSSSSWRRGADRASVRKVIEDGTPDGAMPAFGTVLASSELGTIVDYVLSLETSAAGRVRRALLRR